MAVKVVLYPLDHTDALVLEGDAVSFVNDASYGPAKNFKIAENPADNDDGEVEVVLVNFANVYAVKVEVT